MSDLELLTQSLARSVKHWRAVRGFTLDVLAARAGVSRGMLIQIEQARTNPSLGTVVKIGDALGVSITTLLDYEKGPNVHIVPAEQAVRLWHTDSRQLQPAARGHRGARPAGDVGLAAHAGREQPVRPAPQPARPNCSTSRRGN